MSHAVRATPTGPRRLVSLGRTRLSSHRRSPASGPTYGDFFGGPVWVWFLSPFPQPGRVGSSVTVGTGVGAGAAGVVTASVVGAVVVAAGAGGGRGRSGEPGAWRGAGRSRSRRAARLRRGATPAGATPAPGRAGSRVGRCGPTDSSRGRAGGDDLRRGTVEPAVRPPGGRRRRGQSAGARRPRPGAGTARSSEEGGAVTA